MSNLPQMKTIIEDLDDDEEKTDGEFLCFVFHLTFMVIEFNILRFIYVYFYIL